MGMFKNILVRAHHGDKEAVDKLYEQYKPLLRKYSFVNGVFDEDLHHMVDDVLSGSEYKVNEGKVVLLREYTGKLTPERTEQILSGEFNRKPKKSTATAFKVKPAIYKKYFTTSISQKEFDSIVDEALALYFAQKGQESEQEAG